MSIGPDLLNRRFNLKSLSLRNRIVMAPMTRGNSPGGVPTDEVASYYRRRAKNLVGLIITEGTHVEQAAAASNPNYPNFHEPASLQGWKRVCDAVHEAGGQIIPQLWHEGMMRRRGTGPHPEAPSVGPTGLTGKGKLKGDALSEREVEDLVSAYARSAANAQHLGFDGIELHGAHQYLVDQFFWSVTNQRTDRYGGDLAQRTRFACDIVRAAREATSEDFAICLRWSQWKQEDYNAKLATTPDELAAFLEPLTDAGVDIFHCSQRRFWLPEFDGSELNLAGWTRKLTGRPTITVGSVGLSSEFPSAYMGMGSEKASLDQLLERLQRDEFDLVAVGRALLQDPEWASKILEGRNDELKDFDGGALSTYY